MTSTKSTHSTKNSKNSKNISPFLLSSPSPHPTTPISSERSLLKKEEQGMPEGSIISERADNHQNHQSPGTQTRSRRSRMITIAKQLPLALILATSIFSTDSSNSMFFPRFDTVNDVPSSYFKEKRVIYGMAERVIDGDTIRVRHCRTRFSCPKPDPNVKRIYDSTLSIRIYGVDCK